MCGIVGYKGDQNASKIVYNGLKKLEYRGYDSAGTAVVGNPSLKVQKGTGTIDKVHENHHEAQTGIGHTRWATHGGITDQNAHPHLCQEEEIAVVHNGIINNYQELKQKLEKHYEFKSETDTEVIPHLIRHKLKKEENLLEACRETIKELEGSYAVVITTKNEEMIAFKKGSPLVLGIGENERFIASDVTPFLNHTNKAIFLQDHDIVLIEKNKHKILKDNKQVEREPREIDWDAEEAEKEDYEHYMLKEIKEQPETVKRAVFQDRTDIEQAITMMDKADKIILTGCGTSSFAADLGAKYLEEAGYETESIQSHELEHREQRVKPNDLIVAISQSGETADLLSVIQNLDNPLLSILNVAGSTLERKSDHLLYMNAGPEIGVASTKAFTSTLTVLKLLQKTKQESIKTAKNSLLETADKIEPIISKNIEEIDKLSDYLSTKDNVFFIGRNKGYDIAKEADLKLKELSYIHSESFPGGEFKHGNISLIEDDTPLISVIKTEGYEEIISNTIEAKSRGATIITASEEKHDFSDYHLWIPKDSNSEIIEAIPFQLLAYETALKKNNNPDRPRNLAKSVTVK